jgi:hypothetical protein
MPTSGTNRHPQRSPRQSATRGNPQTRTLFAAEEAWSRTSADRRLAGEADDREAILEPGFWMTAVVAFLPTVAGCLYLLLTRG